MYPFVILLQRLRWKHLTNTRRRALTIQIRKLFSYQSFSNKTIDIIPNLNLHYNINKIFSLDYKAGVNISTGNTQDFRQPNPEMPFPSLTLLCRESLNGGLQANYGQV